MTYRQAFFCAVLAFSQFLSLATAADGKEDLRSADDAFVAALNKHDASVASGFLHKEFVGFGFNGLTPTDWSTRSAEERRRLFEDVFDSYEQWEIRLDDNVHYRVFGDTGVASGVQRVQRKRKGMAREMIHQRFTRTWQRTDGGWMLVASHRSGYPAVGPESPPRASSEAERIIIETAEKAPRHANVTLEDARLLRVLAESMDAKKVVELGTSTGYSGLWLANALRKTGGKLTTFELDAERAAIARKNFKEAGVDGVVTLVEGDAHKELASVEGPVDLVFIDAEKTGYVDYLEQVLPLVRPGGLIIAHNMRFPTPDPAFIKAATTNPALETIFVHIDQRGMSLSLKKR